MKRSKLIFCGLIALALAVALPVSFAFATPGEEKQAEADAAYAQLVEMQEAYEQAEADYEEAHDGQLKAEAAVEEAQQRIDAATERITKLQELMGNRARTMYRSGNLTVVDLLFGAASFEEFVNNWDFLAILNQNDADMIKETKELRAEIEAQKVILVEQQKVATQKAEECAAAVEAAEAVVAEIQSLYDSLSEEAAELLEQERRAAEERQIVDWVDTHPDDGDYDYPGDDYSGRADAGSTVARAWALYNEGDNYYSWGGVGEKGFDCSGFVGYCLTGGYYRLGTTYTFLGYPEVSDPQPGDIAVNSGHCGIYIGGGMMIHAASPSEGIVVGPVQGGMTFHRW